jgi:hypothetical protein
VVTRADIGAYLAELGSDKEVDTTVTHLQRHGWLVPVHIKGVWAYLPPGEEEITDRYIDLRAWRARDPDAVFALAGEAAAWHLGYLDREFYGPLAIWLPTDTRTPFGLRQRVSELKLGWSAGEIKQLLPSSLLLHQRHLDLTQWSGGIPAFGPEALVVQLSTRVKSFRSWADLIPHLEELASDIDTERLSILLSGKSQSAWQRAAYLLDRGGRHDDGIRLLHGRPRPRMADVVFGDGERAVWVSQFQIVDRLIAPLQRDLGKACQACEAVRRTERRASIGEMARQAQDLSLYERTPEEYERALVEARRRESVLTLPRRNNGKASQEK